LGILLFSGIGAPRMGQMMGQKSVTTWYLVLGGPWWVER